MTIPITRTIPSSPWISNSFFSSFYDILSCIPHSSRQTLIQSLHSLCNIVFRHMLIRKHANVKEKKLYDISNVLLPPPLTSSSPSSSYILSTSRSSILPWSMHGGHSRLNRQTVDLLVDRFRRVLFGFISLWLSKYTWLFTILILVWSVNSSQHNLLQTLAGSPKNWLDNSPKQTNIFMF